PIDEAARGSDAVVLATPWHAAEAAIRAAGDLTDSLLIDCTNPLTSDFRTLAVGHTISGAEKVAGWARGARVVKAFNQTGAGNMANPAYPGGRPIMFVCGDDAAGKRIAIELVDD